ncbi:hypothetical protein IJT93_09460 [bacterium]|nr:hypothetical protein [bacterium]
MIENIISELVKVIDKRKRLRAKAAKLSDPELADCLEELFCHIEIHIIQKCFEQADKLMNLCCRLTLRLSDPDRRFKTIKRLQRKRLSWLEAQKKHSGCVRLLRSMYKHSSRPQDEEAVNAFRAGELLMDLTSAFSRSGRLGEALLSAEKAADIFEKNDDIYNLTAASFNKASLLYDQGRYAESTAFCIDILPEASKHKDLSANVMLQLANNFEALKMPMRACGFYGKALALYYQLGNLRQQADISNRIGWLMLKKDEFSISLRTLRTAFFLKTEAEINKTLLRNNYWRGQAFRSLGLKSKARRYFLLCIVLAEQGQNTGFLNLARLGFYQVSRRTKMSLRTAMTATALNSGEHRFSDLSEGFLRLKGEGYMLPPFTEMKEKDHAMNLSEKRAMRNLIDDLLFCAGANNAGETGYYKKQIQAFLNL